LKENHYIFKILKTCLSTVERIILFFYSQITLSYSSRSKCKQYLYVKTSQKAKRCLRCGQYHKISSIINSGEIVKGLSEAVDAVKTRQNELAIKELGNVP